MGKHETMLWMNSLCNVITYPASIICMGSFSICVKYAHIKRFDIICFLGVLFAGSLSAGTGKGLPWTGILISIAGLFKPKDNIIF